MIYDVLEVIERRIIPVKKFYVVKDGEAFKEIIEDEAQEVQEVKPSIVKKSRKRTGKGTK